MILIKVQSHSFWLYSSPAYTQAVSASKEESAPHPLRKWASSTLLSQTTPAETHHHIDKRVNVDRIIFNNASDDFFPDKFSDHSNIWSDKLSDFRPLFQVLIMETKVRITTGDKSKMEHTFKKEAF